MILLLFLVNVLGELLREPSSKQLSYSFLFKIRREPVSKQLEAYYCSEFRREAPSMQLSQALRDVKSG